MNTLNQYWPLLGFAVWLAYKWWRARKIVALLPDLKSQGAILIDVRSAGEFATASAPGTLNIPLTDLSNRLTEIKIKPIAMKYMEDIFGRLKKMQMERATLFMNRCARFHLAI